MIVYFDTSALVKLVVTEPGTPTAERIWRGAGAVVTSTLVYPEARAALAGAVRGNRIAAPDAERAVRRVTALIDRMALVQPLQSLLWRAGELADRHGLRGFDAVHLASALAVGSGVTFTAADMRLAAAARAEGLPVRVPA